MRDKKTTPSTVNYKAHITILFTNIIFGLNFIFAKNVESKYISPEAFAMLRITAGMVVFWLIAPFCPHEKLNRNDYARLFFAGLFGITINMVAFLQGIVHTTPVDASIIMTLVPLVVLLLSALLMGEQITLNKLTGIVLGAAGAVLLITYGSNINMDGTNLKGNLLCLGCVISYSLYMIILKPLMSKLHPFTVMRWVFLFGFLQAAPFLTKPLIHIQWQHIPTNTLISIAYVVIAATLFTYLLTSVSLQYLKASTAGTYNYLQPVIASFVAIIIGQDTFNTIKLLAACLVFAGVYLVIRSKAESKQPVRIPLSD